jgi:hypothetical protein
LKIHQIAVLAATALLLFAGRRATASLTLTPTGLVEGFNLSVFASNYPNSGGVGPLGIAFPSTGGVLVTDKLGNARVFATDTDGQNAATTNITAQYGLNNAIGLAQLGSSIYMTQQANNALVEVNADGTLKRTVDPGMADATAVISDTLTGHLFVSELTANAIADVNPVSGVITPFVTTPQPDGLVLSRDGSTLYEASHSTGHILGFNTTSGQQVYDSGAVGLPDGLALGAGKFSGNIFANTNDGKVIEVNLTTNALSLIAAGGSRGDFVAIDSSNDSLLLTQTDQIVRLNGGDFVPEPTSTSLIGAAIIFLTAQRPRSSRRKDLPRS